jgi:hypothetical protein
MTQPYVPARDDDDPTTVQTPWPASQEAPATEPERADFYTADVNDPVYSDTAYSRTDGTDSVYTEVVETESTLPASAHVEPVSSSYLVEDNSVNQPSTKDVAKDQAANVKDTAVEQGQHVAGVAKEQASAVKDTAVEQGQQVAGVAKEQASKVAAEASSQVKDLLAEGLSEVRSHAGTQQKRLADGIHSLAGELGSMASKSEQSGPITDFAHQASRKGGEVAHWLENAEPSDVLDELRSFARRRPFAFLAASAVAGAVVGRLARGLAANAKSESAPAVSVATATPALSAAPAPARENISLQEIPTSGSGAGPTTDRPDYDLVDGVEAEPVPFGSHGYDGGAR